jgi:hypothetical protein
VKIVGFLQAFVSEPERYRGWLCLVWLEHLKKSECSHSSAP